MPRFMYRVSKRTGEFDDIEFSNIVVIAKCQEDSDQHVITLLLNEKIVSAEFTGMVGNTYKSLFLTKMEGLLG